MEIKAELKKIEVYFNEFITVVIKNKDHLEVFLSAHETMTEDEKMFCWEYWDIYYGGGCDFVFEDEDEDECDYCDCTDECDLDCSDCFCSCDADECDNEAIEVALIEELKD